MKRFPFEGWCAFNQRVGAGNHQHQFIGMIRCRLDSLTKNSPSARHAFVCLSIILVDDNYEYEIIDNMQHHLAHRTDCCVLLHVPSWLSNGLLIKSLNDFFRHS